MYANAKTMQGVTGGMIKQQLRIMLRTESWSFLWKEKTAPTSYVRAVLRKESLIIAL